MSLLSEEYSKQKKKYDNARSGNSASFSGGAIGGAARMMKNIRETIAKGPTGGTPKDWADKLYGGSTKDAVTSIQNTYKDFEGGVRNALTGTTPDLEEPNGDDDTNKTFMSSQGRSSAKYIGGGRTKERILENSRTQANLTGKRRSSLLTA